MRYPQIIQIETGKMKLNPKNPRKNDAAVDIVAMSIQKYGFKNPLIADSNLVVYCGNTRLKAARKLKLPTVPVIIADDLTPEQIREYALIDNKSGEIAEWDDDLLWQELDELDLSDFDLDWDRDKKLQNGLQAARENGAADERYNEFVDKFKPKLTTDDCFTPPQVYEAAKNWAVKEYGWGGRPIIRPFYPGGDYQNEKYPKNCVVIDNPPFSIISDIVAFYAERNIDYFLFAPHLTVMGIRAAKSRLAVGVEVIYENGARVRTAFVASQGAAIRACPDLYETVDKAAKEYAKEQTTDLPSYEYPPEVMTATRLNFLSKYGQEFACDDCIRISELDSQKEQGKGIFGSGFLISSQKAREASEKNAEGEREKERRAESRVYFDREIPEQNGKVIWKLSEREKAIIKELDEKAVKIHCAEEAK